MGEVSVGESGANRGPAAGPANRRAILRAARVLFVERGYRVPLSAIAREAGVGQGVLYRHFPTRIDLALAVFEENFAELESLATDARPGAFTTVWNRLVELTISEAAFLEAVIDARRTLPDYDGGQRLRDLIGPLLSRAQASGEVRAGVTTGDLLIVQRMIYGVVVTSQDADEARRAARRALTLLGLGIAEGDLPRTSMGAQRVR